LEAARLGDVSLQMDTSGNWLVLPGGV